MTDVIDDYQPHYVTTPAPASTLDGSLIGKEVYEDGFWWEVTQVQHTRSRAVVLRLERDDVRWPITYKPNAIVKYRNRQT